MSTKAHEMASKQRNISIAEFFEKNRHLLGFDNKRKALMTTIKEAVDNSLDACEEANILPEIQVEIIELGNDKFRVIVEDNGPGIVKSQIPKIFAKLLYGSKFHRLKMSRGQQGIGISASVLYSQLTTGKPAKIISKISANEPAHYYELQIDTTTNKPKIIKEDMREWNIEHGTRIEFDLEGSYNKGKQSVDEYIRETAIVNPHITIVYTNPKADQVILARAINKMPPEAKEIKPHPRGIELGILMKMLHSTSTRTLKAFFQEEFSRVGAKSAQEVCDHSGILAKASPKRISREQAERIFEAIKKVKFLSPPTDCVIPIGEEDLIKGLKKEINAEFFTSVSRSPSVYRGNPFIVEIGIAYGGELQGDTPAEVLRFANRVPLLYQQGACSITDSIIKTKWRSYGLQQSQRSLPIGPLVVLVHVASVWVPFTSEAKEALAHYPEIISEMKLALQEAGRKLASYVRKKKSVKDELKKRSLIEKYIPHLATALQEILNFPDLEKKSLEENLGNILETKRGTIEKIEQENKDYDKELASLGRERKNEKEEKLEKPTTLSDFE